VSDPFDSVRGHVEIYNILFNIGFMMESYFEAAFKAFPWMSPALFSFFILILVFWTVIWKGLALWKAARRGDRNWFIALLVVNTAGLLEILYVYFFSKKSGQKQNGPVV